MDLENRSDEQIRALAAPWFPDGTPNPWQVLDQAAAERYIASRNEARAEGEYEVTWPDGEVYANRHGQARLTEEEAKLTAPRIGGTWRRVTETPKGA